ncbi:hypothetical protein [Nocardia carnea]|uniref:hypothetical protein n=1 Tax=Nocardia carnea TaxID=37328 RepID=UPI002455FB08|nr:hypothetical protein [Nocardia carnea]
MTDLTITDDTGLDPADDFVHERPAGVDRWAENIQWNVRDKDGLGVIWHMGTMLEDPGLWHIVVTVTQPDGTVYATKIVAPGTGQFGSPNAEMSTITPYREWKFSFFGGMVDVSGEQGSTGLTPDDQHYPVQIELDLAAAYPVWIPEGSTQFGDWGRFHHEQAVTVRGTVTIDGRAQTLEGIGHRDHSIGPRDMSHLRRAFWGNGLFDSGWGFATMLGEYASGDFQRAALFDSDGIHDATMIRWTDLTAVDGEPKTVTLELNVRGRRVVIDGRIRHGMNFTVADGAEFCMGTDLAHPDRYFLTNLFIDWTCDGESGIGYLDRGALISLLTQPQP